MCGFVGVFEIGRNGENLRAQVLRMSGKIRHRGPDWSGIYCGPRAVLSHERLSIVDPQSGGQPLYSPDGRLVLAVNGEIYNHRELRRELAGEYDFRTGSDCEVILPLYRKYGAGLLDRLNGIFAFALYDIERDEYLIARDPIGVIPLYIGWDADERCYVASELKALEGVCNVIRPFEPGHYRWSREGKTTRWYTRDWFDYEAVEQGDADPAALRSALEAAVRRQLMSDVPYGVLLSGGLDSSLALLVAARAADICGMPRSAIEAVSMPGFGTSGKTYDNSLALSKSVGASVRTIPVNALVSQHFKDISHDPAVKNVTYENAQARARTYILMNLANELGGIVVGTGDLSELALGWCTYNGDHMSMYGVNSGVPKTLVKHLAKYEAERLGGDAQKAIESVLATEISPELLPPDEKGNIAQKTEDIVGPYELHDFFLYHALRRGDSPKKTFYLAQYAFGRKYDKKTLKKWLKNFYKRFFAQQFKRSCMPDGVKIGSVTLSPRADFRMPSDACASLWLEEAEEI